MSDSMPLQETTGVGVLVVDDQTHFRRVALEVVGATPGFVPVGEAASGAEALTLAVDVRPQLILWMSVCRKWTGSRRHAD